MNILNFTSHQHETNCPSIHSSNTGKNVIFAGLVALSCLAFSPAWAGDVSHKTSSAAIHLSGLSIHIGPGGFQLGLGVPYYSYGPIYGYSPRYGRLGPRHFWKPQRHHRHRRHFAPPRRFNRGHGWKNDRPRGSFRGRMGGRGYGGPRGGRR